MNDSQRQQKLLSLAKNDSVYQLWSRCYTDNKSNFENFANAQPEHIRNFLWGYAEAGRLVYQRLTNLACLHMIFPDENTASAPPADQT